MKLIDFYADWCGPCQMLKPVVAEVMSEVTDVDLEEVNIDVNQERAVKSGVMSIPTLVLLNDAGEEIDRKIGALSKDALKQWIESNKS